jgi:hypothetical protein
MAAFAMWNAEISQLQDCFTFWGTVSLKLPHKDTATGPSDAATQSRRLHLGRDVLKPQT